MTTTMTTEVVLPWGGRARKSTAMGQLLSNPPNASDDYDDEGNRNGTDVGAPTTTSGSGVIGGQAFYDDDNDGVREVVDASLVEGGAADVNVWLLSCDPSEPVAHARTDSNGTYRFEGLSPGNYYVVAQPPPGGYRFSYGGLDGKMDPEDWRTACFELLDGEKTMDWSFGLYKPTDGPSLRPSADVLETVGSATEEPVVAPARTRTRTPTLRPSPRPTTSDPTKTPTSEPTSHGPTTTPTPRPASAIPTSESTTSDPSNSPALRRPSVGPTSDSTRTPTSTGPSSDPTRTATPPTFRPTSYPTSNSMLPAPSGAPSDLPTPLRRADDPCDPISSSSVGGGGGGWREFHDARPANAPTTRSRPNDADVPLSVPSLIFLTLAGMTLVGAMHAASCFVVSSYGCPRPKRRGRRGRRRHRGEGRGGGGGSDGGHSARREEERPRPAPREAAPRNGNYSEDEEDPPSRPAEFGGDDDDLAPEEEPPSLEPPSRHREPFGPTPSRSLDGSMDAARPNSLKTDNRVPNPLETDETLSSTHLDRYERDNAPTLNSLEPDNESVPSLLDNSLETDETLWSTRSPPESTPESTPEQRPLPPPRTLSMARDAFTRTEHCVPLPPPRTPSGAARPAPGDPANDGDGSPNEAPRDSSRSRETDETPESNHGLRRAPLLHRPDLVQNDMRPNVAPESTPERPPPRTLSEARDAFARNLGPPSSSGASGDVSDKLIGVLESK